MLYMVDQRRRLLCRIHRCFQTVTEPVQIGPLLVSFTRIADPNRVLDEVAAQEDHLEKISGKRHDGDQLHLPYWAELWDSAFGLAYFLVDQGVRIPSLSTSHAGPDSLLTTRSAVLDLGCGMGFAGVVAARLGARVLFADLEAPALLFARLNSLPDASRVRTRRLNWRTDRLAEKFDLILGADILYERAQWEYLDQFWKAHLAPQGSVLLGEPGRQTGDRFIDWITAQGWTLSRHTQPIPTRPNPIRLFRIHRDG